MNNSNDPIRPGDYTPEELMPNNSELIEAAGSIARSQTEDLLYALSTGQVFGSEAIKQGEHTKHAIDVLLTLRVGADERAIKEIRDGVSRQLAALRSGKEMEEIPGADGRWVHNWIAHFREDYWRRVVSRDALLKKQCPVADCDL